MMSRLTKSLMVVVCVLAVSSTVWSDTIYVKAVSSGDGSSWAHAYGLLQDALDAVDPNDEIWVAAGTYKPTSDYGLNIGDRGKHFRMINRVAIYGGFPAIGDPGWPDRDPNTYETILSGDIGTLDDNSDNCYHVFYHPEGTNLDPNAVLDGFTIADGNAIAGFPHGVGGGMHNWASSPKVINCIFRGNFSWIWGGGMYNDNCSPIVKNCNFFDNYEGMFNYQGNPMVTCCIFNGNIGHGMSNYDSSPIVTKCTFTNNTAINVGGGMRNWHFSSPIVSNCSFTNNSAYYGGGMCNEDSSPTVSNCTFTDNSADNEGGGMFNDEGFNTIVTNCSFIGNTARYGGGMFNDEDFNTIVTNCSFIGNTASYGGGMNNYDNSSPIVTDCTFTNNSADFYGGGMFNYSYSNPIVTNCTFISNAVVNVFVYYYGGGGIYNDVSSPTITNCIFINNTANDYGGGVYNYKSIQKVTNCIFSGNQAVQGNTLACDSDQQQNNSTVDITNCILWDGNDGIWNNDDSIITINYSDIQGGYPGTGNIDADPMFKDPNGVDGILGTEDDNLQLAYISPCIDAGDNTAIPLDITDLDNDGNTTERIPLDLAGHARFTDDPMTADTGVPDPPDYPAVVDMGAYERYEFCGHLSQALKGDLNLDCYIDRVLSASLKKN